MARAISEPGREAKLSPTFYLRSKSAAASSTKDKWCALTDLTRRAYTSEENARALQIQTRCYFPISNLFALQVKCALHGPAECAEKIFRLRRISALTAGNHRRCVEWPRCVCAFADRRREVALFSAAGAVARRGDDCGVALNRADERSGRCPADQRNRGDLLEFDAYRE